jgi:transcriptional regulator with XRE-family HTH domain
MEVRLPYKIGLATGAAKAYAELAGITPTGLAAIEKGLADPRSSTLDRLARVLQAEGVIFIDDDTEPGVKATPELAARLRKSPQ